MTSKFYIEDIFMKFFITMSHNGIGMQIHDTNAASSFYLTLMDGNAITEKQGAYILKLLHKYRNTCASIYDYRDLLENPSWKKPFRVVDNRKQVWVEKDDTNLHWICLKFPFAFKETFDEEIGKSDHYLNGTNIWDKNKKIRKLFLYDFNMVHIVDFCRKHGFEIMDTAVEALSAIEEIWNNQEQYLKTSVIQDGTVVLQNAAEESLEHFDKNKSNNINSDLVLAKSLGHYYSGKTNNMFETIASNRTNIFHCKDVKAFLDLCYGVEGKIVILLDKTDQSIDWVKGLARNIDECGYNKQDFRVCFRTNNKLNPDFNKWVSENGFGGKITGAKFLIFREKPAKWLFKDEKDVTIVASNDLLPGLNGSAKSMLRSHPCVVYINEYKPVKQYGETIVEL
jgi:hypothetical protein